MFETNFSDIDYVIVAVYLTGVIAIGFFANRFISSVSTYVVGGRGAGLALNTASYIGTAFGMNEIMYASIDGFRMGFSYLIVALFAFMIPMFLGITGVVVRRLRELELTTLPEFFEHRYDKRVRVTAGIICVIAGTLNMGLFPKLGAIFITYTLGFADQNGDTELTVNLIMTGLIVLVLLYTIMGGMVSVIVTDYAQFVVLSIGVGVALFYCLSHPDIGWANMVDTWGQARGEAAFNPFHPDSYGWIFVVWMLCMGIFGSVTWAPEATRSLTSRDAETTQRTFLLGSAGSFVRLASPALIAIAAFTYFSNDSLLSSHFFPDGIAGEVQNAPHALPLILGKILPSGLIGILVAGFLSAFLSTHDSYILTWASIFVRDVVNPLRTQSLQDKQQIRIIRITVLCIGLFLLIWGVWYQLPDSVWTYLAVTGTVYISGAGIAVYGGIYRKRASSTGAFAALCGGLLAISALFIESLQVYFPQLTEAKLAFSNFVICACLFVGFSLLFPDRQDGVEEHE